MVVEGLIYWKRGRSTNWLCVREFLLAHQTGNKPDKLKVVRWEMDDSRVLHGCRMVPSIVDILLHEEDSPVTLFNVIDPQHA